MHKLAYLIFIAICSPIIISVGMCILALNILHLSKGLIMKYLPYIICAVLLYSVFQFASNGFNVLTQEYVSQEAAWKACNAKYNGKCRYLGSNYKYKD